MKSGSAALTRPRAYRQSARADAAAETHRRIIAAFLQRALKQWYDEITLEEVARDANVTVQTVIRRFGGKEGLLVAAHEQLSEEVMPRRSAPPGNIKAGLKALVADYEEIGDIFIRLLAQEPRYPLLSKLLDRGRAEHRAWVAGLFSPWLASLSPARRERRLTALVAVCDIYTWKLLRRDLGHEPAEVVALMQDLATGLIGEGDRRRLRVV
jgi:AcrR family transcriptional regulator